MQHTHHSTGGPTCPSPLPAIPHPRRSHGADAAPPLSSTGNPACAAASPPRTAAPSHHPPHRADSSNLPDSSNPSHSPAPAGAAALFAAPPATLADSAAPLALYFHVPYCAHRCLFCPFFINPGTGNYSAGYTEILSREIDLTSARLRPVLGTRRPQAVYFGGGTPSDLDRDDLASILRQMRIQFPPAPDAEITIEGRIRGFIADKARAWVEAGANRFSIGVQSTDTSLRRRMGRLADRDEIRSVLNALCDSGAIVVIDLIYGFPTQTIEMLLDDIRFIAEETGIHGLDLYELRDFPGSPLSRAIEAGRLPPPVDATQRLEMHAAATAHLHTFGFEQFHPRHFRRSPLERSLYNRLARPPGDTSVRADLRVRPSGAHPSVPAMPHLPPRTDIIPFGSGAGGFLHGTPIMLHRDIRNYAALVLDGHKPVADLSPPTATPTHPNRHSKA